MFNVGKNLPSSLPLKIISWFVGKPPLQVSPSSIYKFPIFWSTSNVPILLSSWNPGAKSFVPLKNVMCTSVFSCCVKEVSAILFDKKFKVSIPKNLLAEPKPEAFKVSALLDAV